MLPKTKRPRQITRVHFLFGRINSGVLSFGDNSTNRFFADSEEELWLTRITLVRIPLARVHRRMTGNTAAPHVKAQVKRSRSIATAATRPVRAISDQWCGNPTVRKGATTLSVRAPSLTVGFQFSFADASRSWSRGAQPLPDPAHAASVAALVLS